jgi:hypothetical protein
MNQRGAGLNYMTEGVQMFGFFNFFLFTLHRSLFTIILCAAIWSMALLSPCSAIQAVSPSGAVQNTQSTQAKPTSPPASAQNAAASREVINIVVDTIDGGTINAKDGRKFEIASSTKVIDNSRSHPGARTKTAELFFVNGSLEQVVLK